MKAVTPAVRSALIIRFYPQIIPLPANPIAYISGEAQEGEPARIARGFYFDLESSYEAQVVLNLGSEEPLEIKSDRIALTPAPIYVERHDEAFPDVQLRWNDYYPALGDKTITVRADVEGEGSFDGRKVKAEVIYPENGARLGTGQNNEDLKTIESTISNNKATFELSGRELAPRMVVDGTETGVDEIQIKFTLLSEDNKAEAVIYGTWNVKNNSNTNLHEVLDGEAVFVHDEVIKENHRGKTTGKTDNERGLDFVQKMINHIIVPLRSTVDKEHQENTLGVDGYYGNKTKVVLEGIINGGDINIGSNSTPKIITLKDTNVSHQLEKQNSPKTIKKLAKDYNGLSETDKGKVIDKEILVGLTRSTLHIHPIDESDIGIYELYLSDDWDGDLISNYVEVENEINPLLKNDSYTTPANSENELVSVERGGLGNKWKVREVRYDTRQGILMNGLRIANVGKGYYYFRSANPDLDYDNYGALRAINLIEAVAKDWEKIHPDLYPLKKDMFVHNGAPDPDVNKDNKDLDDNDDNDDNIKDISGNDDRTEIRLGIGDISLEHGGPFYRIVTKPDGTTGVNKNIWDHSTHQNGLSIDIRYPRNNYTEGRVNFKDERTKKFFSEELTQKLIDILLANGATQIFLDKGTGLKNSEKNVKYLDDHHHHLHVDFPIENVPIGEMTLTTENGISSIPADGNSIVRIIVDAKDKYDFPLVSVNVTTTHGTIVNGDYETKNENIGIGEDSIISFELKSGTLPVDEVTVTVKSIPSAMQAKLPIKFTKP
jgi:hypothetical protein